MRSDLIRPKLIGAIGLLMAILLAWSISNSVGGPKGFIRAPSGQLHILSYLQEVLGPVPISSHFGHDGKYFFALAMDPFLQDREFLGAYLDFPAYRAGRILYPMLSSAFGMLGPQQIVWGLIVVNVLAIGLGCWATARLCELMNLPALFGLFFAANPGAIYELSIDSASVLGMALAMTGLVLLVRGQNWQATSVFALAGLARETMILVCVGAALWLLWRRSMRSALVLGFAVALTAGWLLFVQALMPTSKSAFVSGVGQPFVGLALAIPEWLNQPALDKLVVLLVFVSALICGVAAFLRPGPLSWGVAGFIPVMIALHPEVAVFSFNLTRALMPMLTAAPILLWAILTRSGSFQRAHPDLAPTLKT